MRWSQAHTHTLTRSHHHHKPPQVYLFLFAHEKLISPKKTTTTMMMERADKVPLINLLFSALLHIPKRSIAPSDSASSLALHRTKGRARAHTCRVGFATLRAHFAENLRGIVRVARPSLRCAMFLHSFRNYLIFILCGESDGLNNLCRSQTRRIRAEKKCETEKQQIHIKRAM